MAHPVINIRRPCPHHASRRAVGLKVGVGRTGRAHLIGGVTQLGTTLIQDDRRRVAHPADEGIVPDGIQAGIAVVGKTAAADTGEAVGIGGRSASVAAKTQVRGGRSIPRVNIVPAPVPGEPGEKTVRDGDGRGGSHTKILIDQHDGGL